MPHDHSATRLLARAARSETAVILGGWTVVAAVFAGHNYLTYAAEGRPIPFGHALWWSVAEWYTWALLTPLAMWIARRYGPASWGWWRSVVVLLPLALGVAALQVALEYGVDRAAVLLTGDPTMSVRVWLSGGVRGAALDLAYLVPRKIGFSFVTFWGIVAVVLAADYYRLFRERELRAARLESALAGARLDALRAQLQPHFLFNTLNAIASLIPEDPAAAEEMVESLSELLRASLRDTGRREITLAEEIDLVTQYLRIQEIRFQDRLRVQIDVDPALAMARVPPLLLQPLAENAIQHGIAHHAAAGRVVIRAERSGRALVLAVEDDGAGFAGQPSGGPARDGVGIANTKTRLATLYGPAGRLEVGNRSGGGAYARVTLPLRTAVDQPAAIDGAAST